MNIEIEKINFCQLDEKHYCVECCRVIECCFLGPINKKKEGCTIYPKFKSGSTNIDNRRVFCEDVDCLINLSREEKQKLLKVISAYEKPEFRMSKAKEDAGIKNKIEP